MNSEDLIRRTFDLARRGLGATWPNPLVGAVIVKDGRIIAEGHHHRHGLDHAEVDALKNATESVEGATVYVNLEPCCHTNKLTPPCAQRLIAEKVKKVVICNLDPNPFVNGKGASLLREAGIEVEFGVLSEEGEALNEAFFHSQRNKKPFIHLKMATTLDGRIALPSGESQWITGERAREHVHLLRSHHQGIIVGAGTARKDNPKLTVRLPSYNGPQPWRIVFTESGNLDQELHLLSDELSEKTLVYTMKKPRFNHPATHVIEVTSLDEALRDLFERKLINLMLEGGSNLATSFLQAGLVNRVSLYLNPSFLGAGPSAIGDLGLEQLALRPKLKNTQSEWIGDDLYLTGRL